jgi:hypothetical protein
VTGPLATEPLSFRAAAVALKQKDATGRALKAIVLQREQALGIQIATRINQPDSARPHLRVTLGALYQHCPEFKPPRTSEDMTKSVRAYITAIEDRIAEVTADKVQELVMPHFHADRRRLADLESATDALKAEDKNTLGLVEELSALVAALTGAKKAS